MIAEAAVRDKLRLEASKLLRLEKLKTPPSQNPRGWGTRKFKAENGETIYGSYGFGVEGFGAGLDGVVDAAPIFTGLLSSYKWMISWVTST